MSPTVLLIIGLVALFASVTMCLSVVGVATAEKRAIGRSLAAINAINSAPESMRQELDKPFAERVLDPLAKRLHGLGRRLTPDDTAQRMRKSLDVAGNPPGWTVERIVGLKMAGFISFLILGFVACTGMGLSKPVTVAVCVGLALLGYNAPNLWLYQLGTQREDRIRKEIADALDLLTISVEAGLGFDAALSRVARNTEGPLAAEFSRILQEMQIGKGRSEAMRAAGERTNVTELRGFITAMVQADAFGIPIGQVLRVQSKEMRVKRRQLAEEMAQKIPVKILFPLMLFILPTLFIVVMGPAAISAMAAFGGTS
jgi:tight adherence protein C